MQPINQPNNQTTKQQSLSSSLSTNQITSRAAHQTDQATNRQPRNRQTGNCKRCADVAAVAVPVPGAVPPPG
eukprot:217942-Chlamydomonas_euryale.AAC.1